MPEVDAKDFFTTLLYDPDVQVPKLLDMLDARVWAPPGLRRLQRAIRQGGLNDQHKEPTTSRNSGRSR